MNVPTGAAIPSVTGISLENSSLAVTRQLYVPGAVGQQLPGSSPYTSVVCTVVHCCGNGAGVGNPAPLLICTTYELACLTGVHWK